jgi:6-phosphogluconolactonase (cycloisomerase 2 family)
MKRSIPIITATILATAAAMANGEFNGVDVPGAVFTMDNSSNANHVLVFNRAGDGTLLFRRSVPTGGLGTGVALENQGALALSEGHRWLFVVNAGSHDISTFAVTPSGLSLVAKTDSAGLNPISLTVSGNLLYVLNAGGTVGNTDNITGFVIDVSGHLHQLANSTQQLSAAATGPAQVSFSPGANVLVVTERNTSLIDTFVVNDDGTAGAHQTFASPGKEPFGFSFDKLGHLFVTEAMTATVSSYSVSDDGGLSIVSTSVPTQQKAPCWLLVTRRGNFAYEANAASSSISGFSVQSDGSISLLNADGITGTTPAGPNDLALNDNSHFLYSLNPSNGTISGFRVQSDGSLTSAAQASAAVGANGLAAY